MAISESKGNLRSIPIASAAITTFNSAMWLPRALDSVLMQKTDFPIEIIIGDDCSEDETVTIANAYRELHPDKITVLVRSKNIGIQRNYYDTFEHCRGKFIAWLDADDYWTDPDKLAVQVSKLESDPSISVCGHMVRRVTPSGEIRCAAYPTVPPGRHGLSEILRSNFVPSPSIVFRNGIQRNLPAWYFDFAYMTDWPLLVVAALSGDIVLLDRVMADYTLNPGSSFEGKGELNWYEMDARFYNYIESVLPVRFHKLVRAEKGKRYESMAYLLRKQGMLVESRAAALKAFCSPALVDNVVSKTLVLLSSIVREAQWRVGGGSCAR